MRDRRESEKRGAEREREGGEGEAERDRESERDRERNSSNLSVSKQTPFLTRLCGISHDCTSEYSIWTDTDTKIRRSPKGRVETL